MLHQGWLHLAKKLIVAITQLRLRLTAECVAIQNFQYALLRVPGVVALGIMLNPPLPGDQSYVVWQEENARILDSLGRRAKAITEGLNELPGVNCVAAGSLYAYPRIELPQRAIEAAAKANVAPDLFYCLELLKETGIATNPGSGFGQEDGTFHFRTTILVAENELQKFMKDIGTFHLGFLERYGGGKSKL